MEQRVVADRVWLLERANAAVTNRLSFHSGRLGGLAAPAVGASVGFGPLTSCLVERDMKRTRPSD